MQRRSFLSLIGGTALAWPSAARAQEPSVRIVGYLSPRSAAAETEFLTAFRRGLRETGHVEGKNLTIEDRYLPYSLFTDPQLGRVGMTEKEARASGRKLKMGKYPMAYVARAIERGETSGLMKIVVDGKTDKILGAAILGTEGGELVQILGAMMLAGAPYTVLKGAVYIHPTLAEGFFGLMDSVQPVD